MASVLTGHGQSSLGSPFYGKAIPPELRSMETTTLNIGNPHTAKIKLIPLPRNIASSMSPRPGLYQASIFMSKQ